MRAESPVKLAKPSSPNCSYRRIHLRRVGLDIPHFLQTNPASVVSLYRLTHRRRFFFSEVTQKVSMIERMSVNHTDSPKGSLALPWRYGPPSSMIEDCAPQNGVPGAGASAPANAYRIDKLFSQVSEVRYSSLPHAAREPGSWPHQMSPE